MFKVRKGRKVQTFKTQIMYVFSFQFRNELDSSESWLEELKSQTQKPLV